MAKAYYLCPIAGTGAGDDPYRLAIRDSVKGLAGTPRWSSIVPLDQATGRPLFTWGLAIVSAADQSVLANDQTVIQVPPGSLALVWSSVPANQRNRITTFLTNHGVNTTPIQLSWSLADLLAYIGQQLYGPFTLAGMDVADV